MNAPARQDIYATLAPDAAVAARDAAVRIKVRMARTCADIVEIGRDLIEAKRALGHGNFLPWIEAEFGMSRQTADNFVHVAERFGDKLLSISNLPPTVLYALAAPRTTDDVREEVLRRAQDGEPVTSRTIEAIKEQLSAAKESAKAAKQDVAVQKDEANRVKAERDRLLNEIAYLRQSVDRQNDEMRRLKEDGVIHVLPATGPAEFDHSPQTLEQYVAVIQAAFDAAPPDARQEFLLRNGLA